MPDELSDLVSGDANIVVVDRPVSAAGAEQVTLPREDRHSGLNSREGCLSDLLIVQCRKREEGTNSMTCHGSKLGARLDVPDLDFTDIIPDGEIGAVTCPSERRNLRRLLVRPNDDQKDRWSQPSSGFFYAPVVLVVRSDCRARPSRAN